MSDNPLEIHDHTEHAIHAHSQSHGKNASIDRAAMLIAILAVLAASVGSLETLASSRAISAKNDAVLLQNRATDSWNFFQAKSLKKNMYSIAAVQSSDGTIKDDFVAKANKNEEEAVAIQKTAVSQESESATRLAEGEHHEHQHHVLTVAVTLLHVAIAVATISILTGGKRWPLIGSLSLAFGGVMATCWAFMT